MANVKLTILEKKSLINSAKNAWAKVGPRTERALFTWQGTKYQSVYTTFRLVVKDMKGKTIVYAYVD